MRDPGSHMVGTAHTTSRVEALTDGVFAIVMTLMVFEIRVVHDPGRSLAASIAALWPAFAAYAVAFVQLGIYWAGHRNQFTFIAREDHTLRWINLLFLALVSLIPFSAQLIGTYLDDPLALTLFAVNMIAVGLVLSGHWLYATGRGRLVIEDLPRAVVSTGLRRTLTAPLVYLATIPLVWTSTWLALVLVVIVPVLYWFPALIDRLWRVKRRA